MRKFIIGILFIAHSALSFSQQPDLLLQTSNQQYLEKSKKQRRVAKILFVVGGLSAGVGLGIVVNNLSGLFDPNNAPPKNEQLADILGYSGLVLMTASVPFLVLSVMNKKKAKEISF